MDFACPNCQKTLHLPEDHVGPETLCLNCNTVVAVPALPSEASLAQASEATFNVLPLPDTPGPPPLPPEALPLLPTALPLPPRVAAPPVQRGDYTTKWTITLSLNVIPWITPSVLLFLFLTSFFPWFPQRSLWNAGFGSGGDAVIGICAFLLMLALPMSVLSLLMQLDVIPPSSLNRWRGLVLLCVLGLAMLLLVLRLLIWQTELSVLPIAFMGLLAFWLHLLALFCTLVEMIVQIRGPSKPFPRIEFHG